MVFMRVYMLIASCMHSLTAGDRLHSTGYRGGDRLHSTGSKNTCPSEKGCTMLVAWDRDFENMTIHCIQCLCLG